MLESLSGVSRMNTNKILAQLIEDMDLAIIKAKAQLEYSDDNEPCSCRTCDMIRRGYEEDDTISGDLMGDEK